MKKFISKFLIIYIFFLIVGIVCKLNINFKEKIHYYLYEDNFAYLEFRKFYDMYFGNVLPFKKSSLNVVPVFDDKIKYNYIQDYFDGCELSVDTDYLVPVLSDGVVTYIGEKENYGNVIIVTTNDDVNIWYGNMSTFNFKLYDTIKKGEIIGQVLGDSLYIVVSSGNNYLDYHKYL